MPINFTMLKSPLNWIIVILILMIGGFALHVLFPANDKS